jgi:hypothetical protein
MTLLVKQAAQVAEVRLAEKTELYHIEQLLQEAQVVVD